MYKKGAGGVRMRGNDCLNNHPYIPFNQLKERQDCPYICRLAPGKCSFAFEWLDPCDGKHTLYYRLRNGDETHTMDLCNRKETVTGLLQDTEYEFYVENALGKKSNVRIVRTGDVPEGATVINYLHPDDDQYAFSGHYLCSPSLVRVGSGRLIAGMDVYGPQMAQNLSILFYSDDEGKNWSYLNDLYPFYWGTLFYHKGKLYILGLSTEYGNLQIAYSEDEGKTWSAPTVILYGSSVLCANGGMHRAPMQLVTYNHRLYTTCEYGCWEKKSHLPAILSIHEDDDLMTASNWTCSTFLQYEGEWKEQTHIQGDTMEGNIVIKDGVFYDYLRWSIGKALILKYDPTELEKELEYVTLSDMPVSNSMFRILEQDGEYFLITNRQTEEAKKFEYWSYRNVLSIFRSKDLVHWELCRDIINHETCDAAKEGFQYPTVLLEDNHLLTVVRSAFNQANSAHNSNYMLFWNMEL